MPPKKAWLRRKQEDFSLQPRIPSEDSNAREPQRNHQISPEATLSTPSFPEPELRTQERSRTTGSDEALAPSPGSSSSGSYLQTGCFEAFRNALRHSVVNIVGSRRKRTAAKEESETLSNQVPMDHATASTQRDDDANYEEGTRRRPLNPGSPDDTRIGSSPRKRTSPATEKATSEGPKSGEQAAVQEASEISGQKEPKIVVPSPLDWVSEETVDYRVKSVDEHGQLWFRGSIPEANEPPEPQGASSSTSRATVDVDRLLMPPPPVPWGRRITRRKVRQPAFDSTTQIPSSLFSADHFLMGFSGESQRSTSTQSSPSADVAPQSSSPPTQTWDLGSEGKHQQPGNVTSGDLSAEAREQEQPDPSNQTASLARSHLRGSVDAGVIRRNTAWPISDQPAEYESRSEYQRSEHHASSQDKGEPSMKAPQKVDSFREKQDAGRTAVHVREGPGKSVQENPPDQDVLEDLTVSQDPGRRKSGESAASKAIRSVEHSQDFGANKGAAQERGGQSVPDSSTEECTLDVDSTGGGSTAHISHGTEVVITEPAGATTTSTATTLPPTKTESTTTTNFATVSHRWFH